MKGMERVANHRKYKLRSEDVARGLIPNMNCGHEHEMKEGATSRSVDDVVSIESERKERSSQPSKRLGAEG